MAACMNCVKLVRGQHKKLLHMGRLLYRPLPCRLASTEPEYIDPEFDEEEYEQKLAKIRDCSGLNKEQKLKYDGKMPEVMFKEDYRGNKRNKLRRLYAEHGASSGINPGVMFPSKAELADLWEIENDWTPSFQELMTKLHAKKASEAEAAELRDDKIEKSMAKMDQQIKQYHQKLKRGSEQDQIGKDRTETLLEEFRELYGFSVTASSSKFKSFRSMKAEEAKMVRAKQKKDEKKSTQMKSLQDILEKGTSSNA